jgi:intein/homing endonuclease
MSLFRLRDEGYSIIKRFLVEGELAWENVIDPKQPELGIRGVKFLPAEYYETLIDTKTNRPVGIIFDTEKFAKDIHEILSNTFMGSA